MAPVPVNAHGPLIQFNRGGMRVRTPPEFWAQRDASSPVNLIHSVVSGHGQVKVRGRSYSLEPGTTFVLPAYEAHTYSSDPKDPMTLNYVEYGGGSSDKLTAHILDAAGPIYGKEMYESVRKQLLQILTPERPSPVALSLLFYQLMMLFFSHQEHLEAADFKHQKILDYIEDNLSHTISLAEISKEFHYNPSYFSARFSKTMGISFLKYVMSRRIRHACYLLTTTDQSMEQIAHSLGFYDLSHFTTRFKAQEGMTPTQYRKSNQLKQVQTKTENPPQK